MYFDNITLLEGSQIINITVATDTTLPLLATSGELIYLTTGAQGLYLYDGSTWQKIGESHELVSHIADGDIHLSVAQNALLDAAAITSTELNQLAGVSSNVQTQLDTETTARLSHEADMTTHVTLAQNTWIDDITASSVEVNRLVGVTGSVQSQLNSKVNLTGATMNGNIIMSAGTKVTLPDAPIIGTDAVNKNYVDSNLAGLSWKPSVKAATTVNVILYGTQTVDGVALIAGDRVLVKNQTITNENGIYVVSATGWSRSTDMDQTTPLNELNSAALFVEQGATQTDTGWTQINQVMSLGTDAVTFTQFNGAAGITAGTGLLKTGNVLDVNLGAGVSQLPTDEIGVDVYATGGLMTTVDGTASSTVTGAQLSLTKVGTAGTYKSVTTDTYGRVTAGTNPTTIAGYGITDAAPINQTTYIGTTAIAGNRASAAQTLTGISIDGSSVSCTGNSVTASSSPVLSAGTGATCLAKFQNCPAHGTTSSECNGVADAPNLGWWIIESKRHSNAGGLWGTQIAWGWEDNANRIFQRNAQNGTWSAWTEIIDAQGNAVSATYATTSGSCTGNSATATTATNMTGGNCTTVVNTVAVGAAGGSSAMQVMGNTSYAAMMSFHRASAYAINMGLDNDNIFRLGGWSNGTNVYRFSSDTSGNFTASGNVTAYSDARLKADVVTIPDALSTVSKLRGVNFMKDGKASTGVIAQEVQAVMPTVVLEGEYLSVAYGNMVGVLIEAIKELNAKVDAQAAEINFLKGSN